MIIGHVQFSAMGCGLDKWIHSFHMPLLFVISGFLYSNKTLSKRIHNRIRTLIVPYFVFGTIFTIMGIFFISGYGLESFRILLFENTAGSGVPIGGALWFLTSLFFADLFFAIISSTNHVLMLSIIITITGLAFATFLPFRLPYGLDAAMVGVGFMYFGTMLKKRQTLIELSCIKSLLVILVFSILSFVNGYVNMHEGKYAFWPLFIINAFGMTIGLWNLSRWLSGVIKGKVRKYLISIGSSSIIYLCLNQFFLLITHRLFLLLFPYEESFIWKCVLFIIVLIELNISKTIICNTSLRKLIGR